MRDVRVRDSRNRRYVRGERLRARPPLFYSAQLVAPVPRVGVSVVARLARVEHAVAAHVARRVAQVAGVAVDARARGFAVDADAACAASEARVRSRPRRVVRGSGAGQLAHLSDVPEVALAKREIRRARSAGGFLVRRTLQRVRAAPAACVPRPRQLLLTVPVHWHCAHDFHADAARFRIKCRRPMFDLFVLERAPYKPTRCIH